MSSRSSLEGARSQNPGARRAAWPDSAVSAIRMLSSGRLEVGCIRKIGSPKRICFRERTTEYTENSPGSWILAPSSDERELIPTDPTVLGPIRQTPDSPSRRFLQVSLNIREGYGVESVSNKLTSYRDKTLLWKCRNQRSIFPQSFA